MIQKMNRLIGIEVSGLSSGTMSGLIRDAAVSYGYQTREYWFIDQVQARFRYFVDNVTFPEPLESWQEAYALGRISVRQPAQTAQEKLALLALHTTRRARRIL